MRDSRAFVDRVVLVMAVAVGGLRIRSRAFVDRVVVVMAVVGGLRIRSRVHVG
jgi:hypothetical protein